MKNFIYISLLLLGLFATSCTKEEVVMSNTNVDAVPAWDNAPSEKMGRPEAVGTPDQGGTEGETGAGQTVGGGAPPIIGDITDPNNDPDGKKKKY